MNNSQILNRRNVEYYTSNILISISLISIVLTYINRKYAPSGYEYNWLLPLSYGILLCISTIKQILFKYLGIMILNFVLFTRYVILPLFSSLTGLYFHASASGTNSLYVILIMLYEMVCIYFVLNYAVKNLERLKKYELPVKKIILYDTKVRVYIIAIILGIIAFLLFPEIRDRMNFIFINNSEYNNLNTISSFGYLFSSNIFKILFLITLSFAYHRRIKGQLKSNLLVLIIAFINICMLWSLNRLTVLAQAITTLSLLNYSSMISKRQSYFLLLATTIAMLSISSYRMFGYGELNYFYSDSDSYFDAITTANYLQAYFGGPDLISTAIQIKDNDSILKKIGTLSNEVLSSILFVRQLFPLSPNSSTVIFNKTFGYFGGNSMILPTLGQSYMYFGFIGAPLLSIIFCYFLYKAEKALIQCETLGEKYALSILVIWMAFFPMQNLNIITATFFNIFLPLYIIIVINKRLKI